MGRRVSGRIRAILKALENRLLLSDTAGAASKLAFTQQPTITAAGTVIDPATGIQVAVEDASGNIITSDSSGVTVTLSSGTFSSGNNSVTVAATGGIATFSNLTIDTLGTCTLTAGDGSLTAATSSSFIIRPSAPAVVSINRLNPSGSTSEGISVTYAVTFNEPVTGVTPGEFQLALTGTTASSTVVVTPTSGYNSVYDVTVKNVSGQGTLGLNLATTGSIVDQYGDRPVNVNATFLPQQVTATVATPGVFAVGDVNGDGIPDVVAANGNSDYAGVSIGNGDGTFEPYSITPVAVVPMALALADVNGDGKLDLISLSSIYGVEVAMGNGDGTFQYAAGAGGGDRSDALAVADINGDGRPDIVITDSTNHVIVLLNNGNGSFQTQPDEFAVGNSPHYITVADVNGDGKPNLVVANRLDETVSVLLGNGDGTFQPQKTFAVGRPVWSVAVGDLNGDGKPNIVTPDNGGNAVGVWLGNGDGTFQDQQTYGAGTAPLYLALGDINGDGKLDVVASNYSSNNVSVLLGNGDGTFQAQELSLSLKALGRDVDRSKQRWHARYSCAQHFQEFHLITTG